MMGGSQQKQHTKYKLLSNSIIHLLHSDQFVLINPHKGTVSETKAPSEQWEYPTLPTSTSPQLKCSPSQHIVAPCCPEGCSLWARDRRTPTSRVHLKEGVKGNVLISASRMKYLPEKPQCNGPPCIQVTPSINSEMNLDRKYKEQWQRKRRGVTVISKDVRKLDLFVLVSLSHLQRNECKNSTVSPSLLSAGQTREMR